MSELVARGLAGLGVLLVLIGLWAIYRLILSGFTDPPPEKSGGRRFPAPSSRPGKSSRPAPSPVPLPVEARTTDPLPAPAERERLVLLVARHDKVIQSPIAGVYINLGKCFADLGFLVQRAATLSELETRLESGLPGVMALDLRLGPRTLHEMARLARRFPALSECVFLCYNAERPEALTPPAILPHAHFLGLAFASQQVMEILAPAFEFEPVGSEAGEAEKDTGAIFEGTLSQNSLPEILQFLEIGRRTGLLSLEAEQPAGVINFEEGGITSAQTHLREGAEAVIEMLGLNRGKFRFFPGKVTRRDGQRLSVTAILMHWAKHLDETGEMAVRTEGEDFRFNPGY